jgi:hypothetical protein
MSRAEKTELDQQMINEWLKTNEITVCEPLAKTDPDDIVYTFKVGSRGRKKKET